MRKLFILFFATCLVASCGGVKGDDTTDTAKGEKNSRKKNEEETTSESSKGNWSGEDKDSFKADYSKTFKNMKANLKGEDDFDETDFDKQSKKVSSCMLNILEGKYESYAAYKKASKKPEFQEDRDLMTEMADCQQDFMDKYNKN